MIELIRDPEFLDPSAWSIAGFGGSVTGGQLKFTLANVPNASQNPPQNVELGKEYDYSIEIASYVPVGLVARALVGNQTIWDKSDGAGVFEGSVVASNTTGLVFQATVATYSVERVSLRPTVDWSLINYPQVRQGIRAILLGITDPAMPSAVNIAWENRKYNPQKGVAWIRETLIPGAERKVAFDELQTVGIVQFDLNWPLGNGTEEIEALVDTIKDAFAPNTTIADHALVYRTERLAGRADDKWYTIPIRLTYRAFAFSVVGTCGLPAAPAASISDEADSVLLDELGDPILEDA